MEKQKKQKIFVISLIILVLAILGPPLLNLVFAPQRLPLAKVKLAKPLFAKAGALLRQKCSDCHSTHLGGWWYTSLPGAKQMIMADVRAGLAAHDMTDLLFADHDNYGEVALAKLETSIRQNSMPPLKYLLLHWNLSLSASEKSTILKWIRQTRQEKYGSPEIIRPIPTSVTLPAAKVALGAKLFHDKRLSGDNTISCASCHDLAKGGTDQLQFSVGINKAVGSINAPTVYNSSFNVLQFWDGRAKDLAEQAAGPVNNPIEMGSNWKQVLSKLQKDADYQSAFKKLYPDGITAPNIQDAIAVFEESLITPHSRFDEYLRGNQQALNTDEQAGYQSFLQLGCVSCHLGVGLGGTHFEKMGKYHNYFTREIKEADLGRFNVTKKEQDRHCFKVPLLRNIAVTFPYFHDGRVKTLAAAVEQMAYYQLDITLDSQRIDQLEKFLRSLTGKYQGKMLK